MNNTPNRNEDANSPRRDGLGLSGIFGAEVQENEQNGENEANEDNKDNSPAPKGTVSKPAHCFGRQVRKDQRESVHVNVDIKSSDFRVAFLIFAISFLVKALNVNVDIKSSYLPNRMVGVALLIFVIAFAIALNIFTISFLAKVLKA